MKENTVKCTMRRQSGMFKYKMGQEIINAVRHLTTKSCAKWQNFGSGLSGLGCYAKNASNIEIHIQIYDRDVYKCSTGNIEMR